MGGVAKTIGQGVGTALTLGTNRIKGSPTKRFGDFAGNLVTGGTSGQKGLFPRLGQGNPDAAPLAAAPGGQSPTELLANTGGAPILAQIVMGVDPDTALATFFGKLPGDEWNEYKASLNPKDVSAIEAVSGQLKTIQSNTNLRNEAVQKVINDFPNITARIAQDRVASGQEFDEVTKGYMKQALDQTAAKFAAGGGLSSGAANEAFSRVGAEQGLNKLGYMGEREGVSRAQNYQGYNLRLGEVNALRDFQNTMLGRQSELGFSANQANLGRIQQGGMANAEFANQRSLQASQNQANATAGMFGALGSLGGAAIGGMLGGPVGASLGSQAGSSVTGSFNKNAPKTYTTSYGRILGGR